MTFFLLLLATTVLAGLIGTTYTLLRDGRGPAAPPASHSVDPSFLPPARALTHR